MPQSSRAEDGEALSDFVFRQFAKRLAQTTDRKAAGPHQRLDGDRVDRRIVEMEQRQQRQILGAERLGIAIIRPGLRDCGHFGRRDVARSEEHTSELKSLMRNSYAVLCLKKKQQRTNTTITIPKSKQQ